MSAPAVADVADWNVRAARTLYNVDRWGAGYFDINADGEVVAKPLQNGVEVAINDVIEEARARGLKFPLLIRFQDILRDRVREINEAFNEAIAENKYQGLYRGVYPIKVNQLREVLEEILDAGKAYHYGIEVGSKPECFAGLSVHADNESLIVCNGYKDDNFIRTALIGRKLGKKVILIAEKLSEVRAITRIAKDMGVDPMIGLRVRLVTKGAGKWAESGGEHAKFGLATAEILVAAQIMKDAGMSTAFKLLHFHIGSQVPDILIIKRAVREAARYYAKLRKMGHPIEYLDVGGGLAIDYDGSRSTFHSSMNYSVDEYARDVVYNITDVCDDEKVPHPGHYRVLLAKDQASLPDDPKVTAAGTPCGSTVIDPNPKLPLLAHLQTAHPGFFTEVMTGCRELSYEYLEEASGFDQLLGRREQSLDRDLMLPPLGGVGVAAGRRIDPHDTRGQQGLRILGSPLHGLAALLAIGEGHREGRRVSVALQVDPVAADPQRMVDLEPVGLPIAGLQMVAHLVVDVRDEGLGLPIGQIVGLEVVDPHAHRVQGGAVDGVAGPEGVERRG